jgi:hypothetical protein
VHLILRDLQPRLALAWEQQARSARGVQDGGQALRIRHITGVEVRGKRSMGVQASPLNPGSLSPRPSLSLAPTSQPACTSASAHPGRLSQQAWWKAVQPVVGCAWGSGRIVASETNW